VDLDAPKSELGRRDRRPLQRIRLQLFVAPSKINLAPHMFRLREEDAKDWIHGTASGHLAKQVELWVKR
jgi:hypothetical protein